MKNAPLIVNEKQLMYLCICVAESVVPFQASGHDALASMYGGVSSVSADNATYCRGVQPINIEPVDCDSNDVEPLTYACLLYTSPSPRDGLLSRMPSSA